MYGWKSSYLGETPIGKDVDYYTGQEMLIGKKVHYIN